MDSDSNNLCIPEDAFEQFQAVSMYQEEEYITLSDIVPVKTMEPDPDFSHVSYDNEVTVTTENEVNSTVNDNTEVVESVELQNLEDSCKKTNECSDEGLVNTLDQDEPKLQKVSRRGRKKKHVIENDTNTVINHSGVLSSVQDSSDNQINTDHESPVISSTSPPRKRGRKPKSKPVPAEPVAPLGINQDFSNISNTPFSSDPENSDNVIKKKRGRPKKILAPNDQTHSKAISDMDTSELSSSDNYRNDDLLSPSKLEIRTKGKRGRPRKVSLETNIDHQIKQNLEVNEFQIENLNGTQSNNCNISKSEEIDLANIEQEHLDEKVTPNYNSKAKSDKDSKILSVLSEDDDLDDISLSKLKDQPDTTKSADGISENSTNNSYENTCSEPLPNPVKKGTGRAKKGQSGRSKKISSKVCDKSEPTVDSTSNNDTQMVEDETDDLSLSTLKEMKNVTSNTENDNTTEVSTSVVVEFEVDTIDRSLNKDNETPSKRNTKVPAMSDFEYNIDSVVDKETTVKEEIADNDLLMEDTSKRPIRRRVPKLKYDEGSDEDPFANVELSDDDEPKRRRGNKYYSDDEYIPGRRGNKDIDSTDSEAEVLLDEAKKLRRRKLRKKSENQSPRKKEKGGGGDLSHNAGSDVEICLQPTVIKASDDSQSQPSQAWGSSSEFENFLAKKIQGTNLKIKKLSATDPTENKTLKIPVIDPEARKTIEMCTQTKVYNTVSTGVQTNVPFDIPMKETITLTPEQSEKACYFLNSIVKTTSELGTLMTQKSEDFIKKKINTAHVTDTMKMDYCVKKSFLLFKLAKHNLMQMEEDLAKQYDEFLKSNNLMACREVQKEVVASAKPASSDSDCEIVEEPVKPTIVKKYQAKPKFNPKTVFLNKELSIKIAKKPTENKKLDIKGRHTVWINDTVMVKKVKPTQSFLAQDSRNKKPPDNIITTKMVSDFFKNYYHQNAISVCAPFVSTDWLNVGRDCVCNYFVVQPASQCNNNVTYSENGGISTTVDDTASETNLVVKSILNKTVVTCPETLLKMCFRIVKNRMNDICQIKEVCQHAQNELTDGKNKPVSLVQLCLRAMTVKADNILGRSPTPLKNKPADNTTLLQLCLKALTTSMESSPTPSKNKPPNDTSLIVLPLKTLCHQRIVSLLYNSCSNYSGEKQSFAEMRFSMEETTDTFASCSLKYVSPSRKKIYKVKSLLCLCVELIQQKHALEIRNNSILMPKFLKSLAFEHVKQLLYGDLQVAFYETSHLNSNQHNNEIMIEGLTINSVNTLSEEAFLNLEQSHPDSPDIPDYLDDFGDEDQYDNEYVEAEEENQTETSWVSQVQMQELRSCVNINSIADVEEIPPIVPQIKLEPLDNIAENIETPIHVKAEMCSGPDEMTIIPHIKAEVVENSAPGPIQRQDSNSYDVDAFEKFVSSNKLMNPLNEDDIFSQSALRVHRQHEPDYELDDMSMSLLVPQTYEPLNIETAKGSLMESSSDEGSSKTKKTTKKKPDKRHKGKQKKNDPKTNKETPSLIKEKAMNNEVATLTKKMRDRIRQEEKKDDSTDSESESRIPLRLRNRKEQDKSKSVQKTQEESEIQCSNVDSTDQVDEDLGSFTGFTAIDQNEITTYQKYMKYVYDKIIPDKVVENPNVNNTTDDRSEEPLIALNEPVELLECEPTMPIFDDETSERKSRRNKGKEILSKKELTAKGASSKENILKDGLTLQTEEIIKKVISSTMEEMQKKGVGSRLEELLKKSRTPLKEEIILEKSTSFIERHGWQCYPVNPGDLKLYQTTKIVLEKLPETFVQTYMEYQGITRKDESDEEIDRLTNLNSLNRGGQLQNWNKIKIKTRRNPKDGNTPECGSRVESPTFSDHYELELSDDEGTKVEDEVAPPAAQKHTENTLAKNLLMDDNDSDCEGHAKVKQEPTDHIKHSKNSKSKKKEDVKVEDSANLMLTADKMMNKELTLLHAPVVPTSDVKNTPTTGPVTRNKQKSASKNQSSTSKMKTEEDSSSEEEKQWVTTKEKLLKRVGKKEHTSLDDAKRAKLVSEFIERRADFPDAHKRGRTKSRRSNKKFLERQKQLRVLSRELFGESSDAYMSKRSQKAQASLLYKGRRNIRKVIDKKSLARSTVVANMEEFERKRRLNSKQTKLRELLGCEEGVNVLVINDEVCLEYDFEENRPVVTVHPFFTKVMKAHQYEGVKFMWDACFESLAEIKAGHPGGGCILAHCMGLGKTLQVLALLHTVLTHPGVRMQRVLVCCPLSTVLNWVDEIHKWIGPVTNQIKVFELSKLKKTYERAYQLEDWYNGGGIFIIGYELFRSLTTLDPFLDDVRPTIINKIRTALLDPGPDIVVCDEGHLLKNDCSVLAVAMSRVITKRRIILTGTPMQNNLREYYCMVNFVKPNLLGTYAEYSNRFENPIMNGQHRDSREEDIKLMKARTHILHKVLEGCLQRQEASVLYPYLPKKYEYTVFISLTQCQWDLYKHYLNNYGKHTKQSILKDFHILQKIWSHPQVLHNFQTKARDRDEKNKIKVEKLEDDLATEDIEDIKPNAVEDLWWLEYLEGGKMLETLDSSNKFIVVFRILDECVALGDKVLIFSTSLFCLDALEYFLKKIKKWSLGQEYFRLDGSVPAEVRQNWCREFNSDNNYKTKLFLVSTRAGCLGLNMTAANRVIIMDTSWNPAHDIQSIFRVYRFGQKKDCYIYRLVAMGTMEQKIYERSVTKQAVACRVVDEQQIDRHYNMAELTELYKIDEGAGCVVGGVAAGVRDVALLRVARDAAAALHAVHEHDSLLRGDREQGLPEHERNAAWMQFQQEHTHKHMENKLIINIPSVSLKRVHGHDYAQSPTTTEIKTEASTSHDSTTNEPKAKKGKKPAVLKCNIPIQEEDKHKDFLSRGRQRRDETTPSPSTSTDYTNSNEQPYSSETARAIINQEELMVERITDILLRYNFKSKKGSTEISKLIARVRNMVKKGYIDNEDMSDELTASIAKVLLPNQLDLPKVTNIMCESINNSAAPNALPSGAHPELITSDPSPNYSVFTHEKNVKQEPGLRTRRKAALEAVKNMDSLAQDVIINLDDDYDSRDTDFVPLKHGKLQKQTNMANDKGKRRSKNSSLIKPVDSDEGTLSASPPPDSFDIEINPAPVNNIRDQSKIHNTPKQTNAPKKRQERPKDAKQAERKQEKKTIELEPSASTTGARDNSKSIDLLSDDDEPISSLAKPKEQHAVEPIEKLPQTQDKDEVVPLPTLLLKNQNFINIVAHTYLVGNPMLDEDAAKLAAQYSTLKALKEAERTGQDVCSGPIYDIAVKVIGKEVLKDMQSVNPKAASSSANDAAASIQKKEKMIAAEKSSKEKAKKHNNLRDNMIMEKLRITKATPAEVQPSITVKPTASMTNKVVPVGLIKTAASVSASQSFGPPHLSSERVEPRVECILPDDDDVIMSAPPDLQTPPAPPLLHTPPAPPVPRPPPAPSVPHAPPALPVSHAPSATPPSTRTRRPSILYKKHETQTVFETQPFRVTVGNSNSTPVTQTLSKIGRKPPVILNAALATASKTTAVGPIAAERIVLKDGTICLDSDEEETTPTARPTTSSVNSMAPSLSNALQTPVPVSLMMANAPGVNLPLPNMQCIGAASSPQQLQPQTLVLRQVVTASGTQAQYVLVPADKLPIPLLPKPPIPEKPMQYTSQPQPLSTQTFTPKVQRTQSFPQNPPPPVLNTFQSAPGNSVLLNKSSDLANTIQKASCKPGDILRISKTGIIEVINRNDIKNVTTNMNTAPIEITNVVNVPKSTASIAAPQSISNCSSSEAANSKTVTQKINETYKVLTSNKVEASRARQISSSSSSSDSRPASPDNPLSILQNVVQIQAVNYPSTKTSNKHKSLPEKSNRLNVSVQHIVSSDLKTSSTSASKPQSSGLLKLTKVPKDKIPKHVDTAVEKQMKKEALLKKITPLLSKSQQKAKEEQKPRGKNTISFDNLNSATTSKLLKVTGKPIDKRGGSSSSKGPVTVDLTHLISDGTTVMKSKRQSSSLDQTSVKKKRTEPMTLKDFNLDDIDDIIELE